MAASLWEFWSTDGRWLCRKGIRLPQRSSSNGEDLGDERFWGIRQLRRHVTRRGRLELPFNKAAAIELWGDDSWDGLEPFYNFQELNSFYAVFDVPYE